MVTSKKATNRGFIELQVLRLVKTCVTSKYKTISHIFGTFSDMLKEKVLGGSM